MQVTTISGFRANIKQYYDNVLLTEEPLIITKGDNGAVLLPLKEYNAMQRRLEVLGDENADPRKLTPRNSLERGMFAVWDRGGRFHTTGMFLLREEVPRIGEDPYES